MQKYAKSKNSRYDKHIISGSYLEFSLVENSDGSHNKD